MEEEKKTRASPVRRRRGAIRPEQVEHRLIEIADRCMDAMPHRIYNKATRQWEEDGSWTFDAANAIRALTEIGKYLGVADRAAEQGPQEIRVDFGGQDEYAR